MSDRILLATFEHEDDLLAATTAVRLAGFKILDAFTPYAVHGLERAMGLRPSRLTWVCFVCGMTGALGMLWFEHWTASVTWPRKTTGSPRLNLPRAAAGGGENAKDAASTMSRQEAFTPRSTACRPAV